MDVNIDKQYLTIALEAAKLGGQVLKKYWGKLTQISHKEYSWDLVTEADQESEDAVLGHLKTHTPDIAILSEESGLMQRANSKMLWVVDPLDGTTNYTHQYPMVCVSIGLVSDDQLILGVIYDPIHDEMFTASSGGGAYVNNRKIQVSSVSTIDKSLLATGFAYDRRETVDNNYPEFIHMTNISQGVRRCGSAALDLAYVAAGRLDGFWERGLKPWDIAAGALLVQEAGGLATSYDGSPLILENGRILAANQSIHPLMIKELS